MADSLPVPSPEEDDGEQCLQKWLANVRALHWSPSDYVKLGLGRHIIGQTEAVQTMATLLRQHVKRLQAAIEDGTWNTGRAHTRELRPTLLIGGSGCGKTLLASHVAQLAGLPYACHDMTALTAQGWVGMSTSDLVSGLLLRSGGEFVQAQWGVLILDEIDKLRRRDTHGVDVGGEGAQRSLLSLLDGGSVQMEWPPTGPRESRTWCRFPCGRLMIILAGAFSGLADIVADRVGGKRKIGFSGGSGLESRGGYELLRQVTAEDLVTYGMMPEFAARLNIVAMRDLSRDALRSILLDASEGPLAVQRRMAQREGFQLNLTDALVDAIVDEAMVRGLGARPLHAKLAEVTRRVFYEMPSQINPLDNGSYTVELGMEALVDGSYRLSYRQRKRRVDAARLMGTARGDQTLSCCPS